MIESITAKDGETVQVGAVLGAIAEGKAGNPSVVTRPTRPRRVRPRRQRRRNRRR
jgi:pyruvate/2-oxoglutarate dehydrogenase complex dihydrolipoamide acyltransferase (E2) component